MTSPYKHRVQIQIRFCDTDALGHINNANYLSYMELARTSYIDAVFGKTINWEADGVILAKAVIDFKLPAMLHDKLYVYIRTSRLGTKSFDIEYLFVREKKGSHEVVCTGSTVMVAYNYAENKTIPILPEWRKRIEGFEGKMSGE
jgi:acyl-CoA thioester hydrolase